MATKEQEAFLRSLEEEKSEDARARAARFGRFTRRAAIPAPSGGMAATVTLAANQSARTNASPINFAVNFTQPVTGFAPANVSFAGSTVNGALAAAITGSGKTYNVAVTGMTGSGLVAVSTIPDVSGGGGGGGGFGVAKSATGTNTIATVSPTFAAPTTPGNLIVLAFSGDAGTTGVGSGWTQSANMGQVGNNGGYLWWRISAGETTFPSYTLSVPANSSWVLVELSGCTATPYDVSLGQVSGGGVVRYTTPVLTPTPGSRVLLAAMLGSGGADLTGPFTAWLNSFAPIATIGQNVGTTKTCAGVAYRQVTGDGITTFSSGADWPAALSGNIGLIISFKVAP